MAVATGTVGVASGRSGGVPTGLAVGGRGRVGGWEGMGDGVIVRAVGDRVMVGSRAAAVGTDAGMTGPVQAADPSGPDKKNKSRIIDIQV